jgi:hypothetical protein
MKIRFWDVRPYSPVDIYKPFIRSSGLHLQLSQSSTLKIEAAGASATWQISTDYTGSYPRRH